jgi:hypothetical protein
MLAQVPGDDPIVTILGFCHSASFFEPLGGTNRINIAAAAPDEFSIRGPGEDAPLELACVRIRHGQLLDALGERFPTFHREGHQIVVQATRNNETASQQGAVLGGDSQPPFLVNRVPVFAKKHNTWD